MSVSISWRKRRLLLTPWETKYTGVFFAIVAFVEDGFVKPEKYFNEFAIRDFAKLSEFSD
jgi:hypothetical protein